MNMSDGHAAIADLDSIAAKASGLADDQVWSIQQLQYRLLRWYGGRGGGESRPGVLRGMLSLLSQCGHGKSGGALVRHPFSLPRALSVPTSRFPVQVPVSTVYMGLRLPWQLFNFLILGQPSYPYLDHRNTHP